MVLKEKIAKILVIGGLTAMTSGTSIGLITALDDKNYHYDPSISEYSKLNDDKAKLFYGFMAGVMLSTPITIYGLIRLNKK